MVIMESYSLQFFGDERSKTKLLKSWPTRMTTTTIASYKALGPVVLICTQPAIAPCAGGKQPGIDHFFAEQRSQTISFAGLRPQRFYVEFGNRSMVSSFSNAKKHWTINSTQWAGNSTAMAQNHEELGHQVDTGQPK